MHTAIQREPPAVRMRIPIVSGVDRGATLLAACDGALHARGVANDNLIPLSAG